MIHPYQLHSFGRLHHEEALRDAQVRNFGYRSKAHRRPHSEEQVSWLSKLAAAGFGSS